MISRVPAAFLLFFFGFTLSSAAAAATSELFLRAAFGFGFGFAAAAVVSGASASTRRVSPSTPFSSISVSSQNSSVADMPQHAKTVHDKSCEH